MSSVFFASKHENLQHDYSDGSDQFVDSCTLIAVGMAKLLQVEGHEPRILTVRAEKLDDTHNRTVLIPKPFEGRIQWGAHVICEAGGIVYDPMLEAPLPLEESLCRL